ncbi:hypothetical protein MJO28_006154 [Puccinia striiformis f. sp. tritici]|uniref:Uncharacterized protein n=1 Tax=Puccinia striiformis f. sp. tritici TaxID=168172 RepID=A0ACC0EHV1_9BASI|nr:hypothetical protein MJO28_006154 [Puccinia striiformis f. sp. tritici]
MSTLIFLLANELSAVTIPRPSAREAFSELLGESKGLGIAPSPTDRLPLQLLDPAVVMSQLFLGPEGLTEVKLDRLDRERLQRQTLSAIIKIEQSTSRRPILLDAQIFCACDHLRNTRSSSVVTQLRTFLKVLNSLVLDDKADIFKLDYTSFTLTGPNEAGDSRSFGLSAVEFPEFESIESPLAPQLNNHPSTIPNFNSDGASVSPFSSCCSPSPSWQPYSHA